MTLGQFKDMHYGKPGTKKRDELESGYENFKVGVMIHAARLEKGLTQAELAEKVGTTKSTFQSLRTTSKKCGFRRFKRSLNWVWKENCNFQ
jgi:ribosome-binding protein aMBF1 (putative translation factor)